MRSLEALLVGRDRVRRGARSDRTVRPRRRRGRAGRAGAIGRLADGHTTLGRRAGVRAPAQPGRSARRIPADDLPSNARRRRTATRPSHVPAARASDRRRSGDARRAGQLQPAAAVTRRRRRSHPGGQSRRVGPDATRLLERRIARAFVGTQSGSPRRGRHSTRRSVDPAVRGNGRRRGARDSNSVQPACQTRTRNGDGCSI